MNTLDREKFLAASNGSFDRLVACSVERDRASIERLRPFYLAFREWHAGNCQEHVSVNAAVSSLARGLAFSLVEFSAGISADEMSAGNAEATLGFCLAEIVSSILAESKVILANGSPRVVQVLRETH